MDAKTVSASCVTLTNVMLPKDANPMGFVHGGVIAKYIDEAAAVVATRHARSTVVTKSFDQLEFHKPVYIGDLLQLMASINQVGTTSMEVGVRVEKEDMLTGQRQHIASAYLTFVSLDDNGRPKPLPSLLSQTDEEKRRLQEAQFRRQERLSHKQ